MTETELGLAAMYQISYVSLLCVCPQPSSHLYCVPTDFESSRKDLHDLLCVGNLRGLVLLGESDPGCGGHGL